MVRGSIIKSLNQKLTFVGIDKVLNTHTHKCFKIQPVSDLDRAPKICKMEFLQSIQLPLL